MTMVNEQQVPDEKFEKARALMSKLTVGLVKELGARRAVSLLAGASVDVLEQFLSRKETANYFREVAKEIEAPDDPKKPDAKLLNFPLPDDGGGDLVS